MRVGPKEKESDSAYSAGTCSEYGCTMDTLVARAQREVEGHWLCVVVMRSWRPKWVTFTQT